MVLCNKRLIFAKKSDRMKEFTHECHYALYAFDELSEADRELVLKAQEATKHSYAPYSHFHVGAAVRLADGTIVLGCNQENAAFPSGLCAERTALFAAGAQHPEQGVVALAIAAADADGNGTLNAGDAEHASKNCCQKQLIRCPQL